MRCFGDPKINSERGIPEAWRVSGKVTDHDGGTVYAMVHPPKLSLEADGSFNDEIPVRIDQDGQPIFPSIMFRGTANTAGHDAVVIHVMDPWQKHAWERTGDRAIHFTEPLAFDLSLGGQ